MKTKDNYELKAFIWRCIGLFITYWTLVYFVWDYVG